MRGLRWLEQLGHPRGALIAAHRAPLVPASRDPMRCDWHLGFLMVNEDAVAQTHPGAGARPARHQHRGRGDRRVHRAALPHLRGLRELEQLDLSSTSLGDGHVRLLLQFPALVHLSLSDTAITSAAIEVLAQIPRLEVLAIVGTAIDGDGAARLAAMSGMRKVVHGTRLDLVRAVRNGVEPTHRSEPHGARPWHVRWFGDLAFLDDHLATVTSTLDARFPPWPAP